MKFPVTGMTDLVHFTDEHGLLHQIYCASSFQRQLLWLRQGEFSCLLCLCMRAFVCECFRVGWVLCAYCLRVLLSFRVSPGGCSALLICLANTFLLLSHYSYLMRPRARLSPGEVTHGRNKRFFRHCWKLQIWVKSDEYFSLWWIVAVPKWNKKKSPSVYWGLFSRNKISHSLSLQWATIFIEGDEMGLQTNLSYLSLRLLETLYCLLGKPWRVHESRAVTVAKSNIPHSTSSPWGDVMQRKGQSCVNSLQISLWKP